MIHNYFPIGSMLACFALLIGAMFITSRISVFVRAGASVASVALAIMIWINAMALIGFPTNGEPHDTGTVLDVLGDKPHGYIYAWVLEANGPRAYRMPWDSKEGQALLRATQKARDEGGTVSIGPKKNGRPGKGKQGDNSDSKDGTGSSPLEGDNDGVEVEINVVPVLPEKG